MKNYLLSFFYSLLYLSITLTGFWGLSTVLDPQTYKIVFMTSLSLGVCLSLFLSIWFRQDDLLFLLFLTLITYVFLEISNAVLTDEISYYRLVAFPLVCLLYPVNVYFLFHSGSSDSFLHSFLKKFFILLFQIVIIYFFTYFIPFLFGKTFLLAFKTNLSSLLRYSFDLPITIPLLSIFLFIICLFLLLFRRIHKIDQIQACITTLYISTFISFSVISNSSLFHLTFISGIFCVLFSLLQISHKMAFLDELTNVPGRRALMTELKHLGSEDYTLSMIDIDYFKHLNDTYGHDVGDQALRIIASTFSQHISNGTLYRYGGEEFVLLFPKKQLDDVLDEMENTRVLLSNSDFFLKPQHAAKGQNQPYVASVHITISCGVAQKQPLQTYSDVLNTADQALYKAKQTGRNKTVYNKNGKFFELF